MAKTFLKYTAALIGTYIVVYNGSKAGTLFRSGAAGGSQFVKTLQGR